MSQLELPFETTKITYIANKKYNRRLKLYEVTVTLYVDDMFAYLTIEYCGRFYPALLTRMNDRLREAYHLRHTRPFGDEYVTEEGTVYYFVE